MKNLNVFEIATSGWEEENFRLMTNLTEKQIRDVIKPMVDKESYEKIFSNNKSCCLPAISFGVVLRCIITIGVGVISNS